MGVDFMMCIMMSMMIVDNVGCVHGWLSSVVFDADHHGEIRFTIGHSVK